MHFFELTCMRTKPNLLSCFMALVLGLGALQSFAQCADTLSIAVPLNGGQSYTETTWIVDAEGPLDSVTVNLSNVLGSGGWPSDLMVTVTDPVGNCVVWGGWNLIPDAGCADLGTQLVLAGVGNGPWPPGWEETPFLDDAFSGTLDTTAFNTLAGTGEWAVTIANGYTVAPPSDWSYEIILHGVCSADCDQPAACNYDAAAQHPLAGACVYAEDVFGAGYDCDGNCIDDVDGDGICDLVDPCVGVEDACGVCNGPGEIYNCGCFDQPAGDCDCFGSQPDAFGVCGGECAADADGDGICDECVEPQGHWLEVDVVAVHDTGVLAGMTTYRVSLVCPDSTDFLRQVAAFADSPLTLNATSGSWYNHPANDDWRPLGILADSVAAHPELVYDSFLTIGVEDGAADVAPAGFFGWNLAAAEFLPSGGQNVTVSETGYMLLSTPSDEMDFNHPGFAGGDHRVLIMQMTTAGDISGQMNIRILPEAMLDSPLDLVLSYSSASVCFNLDPCVGEYDACGVCNGPGAIYECGCSDIPEGDCDCEGNQLDVIGVCGGDCEVDSDMDGVCDTEEVLGCNDADACNFDELATENDGSCTYPELFYDCDGVCLNDADLDGVCDELEVLGCTDSTACNFIDTATEADSTCAFPGDSCDDGDPLTLVDVLNAACECVDSASVDGIFNVVWPSLTVHPNPASDRLTVVLPDHFDRANVELTFVSMSGQIVASARPSTQDSFQWHLGHLPAGAYLLHVTSPLGKATRRVMLTGL